MQVQKGFLNIDGEKLYFAEIGHGYPTIVLLGWSSNVDDFPYAVFWEEKEDLNKHRFIFLHLTNFYKSSLSKEPLELDDYIRQLSKVIRLYGFDSVNLMGHSAGGRIASCFAIDNQKLVNKLVLLSSAGLKHTEASELMLARAHDYFCKKDDALCHDDLHVLRKTLANLYNTDLTPQLYKIISPTLIVWGKNDTTINISKAYIFEKEIPNARLEVYPHLGHMTSTEPEVIDRVFKFLNDDDFNKN